MGGSEAVQLPRSVARRLRREAERLGLTVEEYLLDLLSQSLDPRERAREYIDAALELLDEARGKLERGNTRQAAEKLWGAAALAVKAYAYWRDGKRLASHGELWEYSLVLRGDLGKWVTDAWNAANSMHTCFYEGWCKRGHIEDAIEEIDRLVKEVASRIRALHRQQGEE